MNPKDSSKVRIRADHRISPCIPLCLDGQYNGIVLRCADAAPTPTQEVSLSVLLDILASILGGSYDLPKSIPSAYYDVGRVIRFVVSLKQRRSR